MLMTEFDPYAPRAPKKAAKAKKPKPGELPAEVTRRTKGDAEPTVSLRTADGVESGPVPVSALKSAMGATGELADAEGDSPAQTVAAGQLRAFIERIERLEEDKQAIADDIKDVYAELKGTGFDTKAVRAIVRLRKMDEAQRQEQQAVLDLYMAALGMA